MRTYLKYSLVIVFSFLFLQCKEKQPVESSQTPPAANDIIAYQGNDIYLSNYNGQNIRNITNGIIDTLYYPNLSKFSFDGSKLIFTMDMLTVGKEDLMFSGRDDIFVYDINRQKAERLTNTKYKEDMPCFSPDGKTIVFLSNETGSIHLYLMNSDGSGKRQLYTGNSWEWDPVFSPDSRSVLFRSKGSYGLGKSDIFSINTDGTNLVNLTNNQADISSFVLSKDGKYIYYSISQSATTGIIYKFEIAAKNKIPITKPEDNYNIPKISPDGNTVAFQKFDGSWIYVGIMTSNGENPIIIDKGYDPEFSRDGKSIFYIGNQSIMVYDVQSKTKKTLLSTYTGNMNLEVN